MDMSFGVVMDGPDKAITDETSRVGKNDAENRYDDANRAESSMQLAQGSADRLRALKGEKEANRSRCEYMTSEETEISVGAEKRDMMMYSDNRMGVHAELVPDPVWPILWEDVLVS